MSTQHQQLSGALAALEAALKHHKLWGEQRPTAQALQSVQPFAVDTLSFEQWLQWILIEKLRQLITHNAALPANCGITAMAEQCFGVDYGSVKEACQAIDVILNTSI